MYSLHGISVTIPYLFQRVSLNSTYIHQLTSSKKEDFHSTEYIQIAVTPYLNSNPLLVFVFTRHFPTQQTRYIKPMLAQCWSTVYDGGSTLSQHWFNVSCLMGNMPWWPIECLVIKAPQAEGCRSCRWLYCLVQEFITRAVLSTGIM